MAGFKYEAIDGNGAVHQGVLNADSPRQARFFLREQGYTPLKISEITPSTIISGVFGPRVSILQLSLMTRQLSSLVSAGIPVERALGILVKQTQARAMRQVLAGVHGKIREGRSLASAMKDYPKAFPELYCALVDAGEKSDELGKVTLRLADHLEQNLTLQRKLGMALIYPAIVTVVAFLVTTGLLAFVVPKVMAVFQRTHQELPALTKALIFISDHLKDKGVFWALGILSLVFIIKWLLKDELWRYRIQMRLLKTPILGDLILKANAARLSSSLAILINSGVDVASSLETSLGVVTNLPMKKGLQGVLKSVLEGKSLAESMEESEIFPLLMIYFIASGEESDQLGEMLDKTAKSQQYELEMSIATLISFFEPLIILVMGAIVLIIVLAMLLPIFEMSEFVRMR